ncbi:MAG: flagellin [Candidatus Eisenbacteria bacterium]|uniref:Flagellin n=1 Tax=Eiseniibacteriota bacterium TaxID=2212470 RepID=A0A849SPI9_UNCEI|nr:flagellin [Candidatus Eisenbacteria bacterium]
MPINDITLAGGMRSNLLQLQDSARLLARTTQRLATGLKVNTAVDDASAYFAAQNHRSRANDLAARKQAMGEAIQTVEAASGGIDGITSLIEQAKGVAASARSASVADRATLATQFDGLMTQITNLAADAGYKGTNLLAAASTLTVDFNESGSSDITITGFDASAAGLGVAAAANAWAANGDIDAAVADLDIALSTLRTNASTLASNNTVISTRQAFTDDLINTLTTGASQLTAADQNEEGANMLALQTRQQLGIVSLSLSSQAQQGVLSLF